MNYLREVIEEGSAASSKRFALVVAVLCLGPSVVILSVAAVWGQDVEGALWAVTTPLAAMAGASYVGGKAAERPKA